MAALIVMVGDPLMGDGPDGATTGARATQELVAADFRLHAAAWLGMVACAGLLVGVVRLRRVVAGSRGRLLMISGALCSVLMLAYYASWAAGSGVATYTLVDPGPGVGEATLVALNAFSLALMGPALALVATAATAHELHPAARATGGILAVALLVPFTAWMANLLLPAWLGIVAATAGTRGTDRRRA